MFINRQLSHQIKNKDNGQRPKTRHKYLEVFLKKFKSIKKAKNQSPFLYKIKEIKDQNLFLHQIIKKTKVKVFSFIKPS